MSRTRVERNISYDEEKKKYYVNLDLGRDAHGHQIKKTRTLARLIDARKALHLHEVQRDFGALTKPNDTTVAEWLTYLVDAVEGDKLEPVVYWADLYGTERCYGVVGNTEYLLVCAYESGASDPEVIVYRK